MDEVELRTYITRKIEYSELAKELEPAPETAIPKVPEVVKSGLQGSWLANFFMKQEPIILKSQDREVIAFQDKLQADMDSRKLKTEVVEACMLELKLKHEALEKKMQEKHLESIKRHK